MKFSIRKAEILDSKAIAILSSQLGYKSNSNDIKNRLIEVLRKKDNCVLVAMENERIIGWIHGFHSLRVESDSFVEIGGLVVDENWRKKGIGKKLVERINKWAELRKCDKVRVRSNKIRKESRIFYESIGFILNKTQEIFDKKIEF